MKRFILTLSIFMFSISAFAQKKYDEITYPKLNKFTKSKVETFTLDNGITFFLLEDKELPLIRVNVTVRTGSLLEPVEKTGLASLTGRVMREGGSVNYPSDELNTLLEDKAAFMSTFIGMSSGSASMNLLKENFDELLPVFIDLIENPAFPEDKFELAKTQSRSSISRRNDDQQGIASREFFKLLYGENTPYTSQIEHATLDAISRDDLVEFHKKAFVGKNLTIGVIGDFNTRTMKKKLKKAFGSIEAGSKTTLEYPEVTYDYTSSINLIDKTDVNQSFIFLGHIGGLRENPDYAALQLMNEILSGGFSGRLLQSVRSDLGLAYSVFGAYTSNINYPGIFYTGVMTKSSTNSEAIDAMLVEVEKLQNEAVSDEELEEAKERILNSLIFRYDSKNKILSERINYEYNNLPPDFFDKYVEELKIVSSEDIQRVAKKYIKPNKVQILVVGNAAEIGDQLDKYGKVNIIDITIPQPVSDEEVISGDANAGKVLLKKMAEAIITPGVNFSEITSKAKTTQNTPMGSIEIESESTINFLEVSMTANVVTPQGNMTMELKNGSGKMKMMWQEQPLPPMMVKPMIDEIKNSFINIALTYENLTAEYIGSENVDGTEYEVIKFVGETSITFLVNKETYLPFLSRKNELNQQTGTFTLVETKYSNWTYVDGINYAFTTRAYIEGEIASEIIVESISLK